MIDPAPHPPQRAALTVVIQAGGRSRRMGTDKGLVRLGGLTLIERVLAQIEPLPGERLITTNLAERYAFLNVPLVSDRWPGRGAGYGLLTAFESTTTELVVVVACDMPFVSAPLLSHQLSLLGRQEAVIPRWEGRIQPFHGVYRRPAAEAAVRRLLREGRERVDELMSELDVRWLDLPDLAPFTTDGSPFFNVNSPADLAAAAARLKVTVQSENDPRP